MDYSPALVSPSSDECFWNRLRSHVDTMLEHRRPPAAAATYGAESERGKRLREDSLLLLRGLDSVAASLAQLSDTLSAAQKGVNSLATCSSFQERGIERDDEEEGEEEPRAKRRRDTVEITSLGDVDGPKTKDDVVANGSENISTENDQTSEVAQSTNLKRARNLAVSMASRAAVLARELTNIKSELHFMQERCALLEEENKRLRYGHDGGVNQEEDDLVRLQLEALLAEKSRLAQENANLTRENQSLMQLVEYHQLTSQDLTASYEDVIQGMRLDFSSPLGNDDDEGGDDNAIVCEHDDGTLPVTPVDDKLM